jgi:outer membrane protein, heavy metal efflux system
LKLTLTATALCFAVIAQTQTLTLSEALRSANDHRPAILSAQLNLERAQLSAKAMGAMPATQLGVGHSSRADLGATDMDLFISQPLDIFGQSSAQRRLGEAGVLLAEAELRKAKLGVQSEVVTQYFATVAALHLKESSEGLLEVSESLLNATRRRFEEGKVPEVQVTRAMIERDRSVQTAKLRQSQFHSAAERLAGVIGGADLRETFAGEPELNSIESFEVHLRPDILALESELKIAQAEEVIARRSTLPDLELIGLRSPWRDDSTHFGARLQLTWSFNDFGRQRNEISAARKQAESIRARIVDAEKLAQSEISAIQIELSAANERVESYQSLLDANRVLVQKTQLGFEQGVGTLIDVLESTRSLREIEQELAEARLAANLAIAALYEATGTLIEVAQ